MVDATMMFASLIASRPCIDLRRRKSAFVVVVGDRPIRHLTMGGCANEEEQTGLRRTESACVRAELVHVHYTRSGFLAPNTKILRNQSILPFAVSQSRCS